VKLIHVQNVVPAYSSAKNILKNQTSFSIAMITNVLFFYESQCIGCTETVTTIPPILHQTPQQNNICSN